MTQVVVDSSAIIAILFKEDGHERLHRYLRRADVEMLIGAPTVVETLMVLTGRDYAEPDIILGTFLAGKRHRIVAFDEGMVQTAHGAFIRFGKGRHPAKLNYGDCLAYAVAQAYDLPLLYKGRDFSSTDISSALP